MKFTKNKIRPGLFIIFIGILFLTRKLTNSDVDQMRISDFCAIAALLVYISVGIYVNLASKQNKTRTQSGRR